MREKGARKKKNLVPVILLVLVLGTRFCMGPEITGKNSDNWYAICVSIRSGVHSKAVWVA